MGLSFLRKLHGILVGDWTIQWILFISLVGFPLISYGDPFSCGEIISPLVLKTEIDDQFKIHVRSLPRMEKFRVLILQQLLKNRVLKRCQAESSCTRQDLAEAISLSIEQLKIPRLNLYAYAVAGIAASSAVNAGILVWLNHGRIEFFPTFGASALAQMALITANLMAPFLEPISSGIRHFIYARTEQSRGGEALSTLETQYSQTQGDYSLRDQASTDRIATFRTSLGKNFELIELARQRDDREAIVRLLADGVFLGYTHFQDISPLNETIVSFAQASVGRLIEENPELIDQTLKHLLRRYSNASSQLNPRGQTIAEWGRQYLNVWRLSEENLK